MFSQTVLPSAAMVDSIVLIPRLMLDLSVPGLIQGALIFYTASVL